jgi:hypothetical protein
VKLVVVATSEISGAMDQLYRKIEDAKEVEEDPSRYFGTTTELVPSEGADGFDVFSFVGPSDRKHFEDEVVVAKRSFSGFRSSLAGKKNEKKSHRTNPRFEISLRVPRFLLDTPLA